MPDFILRTVRSEGFKTEAESNTFVFGKTSFCVFRRMVGRVIGETSLEAGER